MRAFVPEYDLVTPGNLAAALRLLHDEPGAWRPIAGGTDLMVLFEAGKLPFRKLINIWNLSELRGIDVKPDSITLGSLTTYTQVRRHSLLASEFPLLGLAASWTGGIATQNRGTLGGNIVNASPAADTPPALLVYDAQIEMISATGTCWVPYAHFHTGYKQMVMRSDELLSRIRLPRVTEGWRHYARKAGTRKAQAISKVCIAGTARMAGRTVTDIRIALGSMAPTVIRCHEAEAAVHGREIAPETIEAAQAAAAKACAPIDDIRSTARYRRQVAMNLVAEFLGGLAA
ncbi:MAG: FAD binding domain-containing protein [Bryobacteraceae bacterium]